MGNLLMTMPFLPHSQLAIAPRLTGTPSSLILDANASADSPKAFRRNFSRKPCFMMVFCGSFMVIYPVLQE